MAERMVIPVGSAVAATRWLTDCPHAVRWGADGNTALLIFTSWLQLKGEKTLLKTSRFRLCFLNDASRTPEFVPGKCEMPGRLEIR